jgi:hypothetical protein
MDPQAALKRAARFEYAVLRTPLHIVDDRVVQRYLDEKSVVRQSFERALRRLDDMVGQLLREPEDARRATHPLSDPAESSASERRTRPAPTAPREGEAQGVAGDADARELSVKEVERIDTLTDELLEQEETQNFAGELAEQSDLRQIQAELKAKHLIEEQER